MKALSIAAVLCALAFTSCIGTAPVRDNVRRYLPSPPPAQVEVVAGAPALGLREVRLPGYLDTSRMVLRTGPSRLSYNDFNLWAEPLDKAVEGTLSRQLRARIGADRVDTYPWTDGVPHDVELRIQFDSFEGDVSGAVRASGRYVVKGASRTLVVPFEYAGSWDKSDFATLAEALGGILDKIAADVLTKAATAR